MPDIIPMKKIEERIHTIRGLKVMLDRDLAGLYGVSTKRLNEQVRRNMKRFPEDFLIQLTKNEVNSLESLRSQIATLKRGQHFKYLPYAFTEQGVAMLSSVLHSQRAIDVNIAIMRVFVNIRKIVLEKPKRELYQKIPYKIEQIDKKIDLYAKTNRRDTKLIIDTINKKMKLMRVASISPEEPFGNLRAFWDVIRSCNKYIYWIDKHFKRYGFEWLMDKLDTKKVKDIKILMSMEDEVDERFRG